MAMKPATIKTPTLGVIYGNRDFFPDHLVSEARADLAKIFSKYGIRAIQLGEADTKLGGVETHAEARKCAELFRRHAGEIDGVLVCLPNFGDEKGVADTLKLSKLNVPVLIQGYPDDLKQLPSVNPPGKKLSAKTLPFDTLPVSTSTSNARICAGLSGPSVMPVSIT